MSWGTSFGAAEAAGRGKPESGPILFDRPVRKLHSRTVRLVATHDQEQIVNISSISRAGNVGQTNSSAKAGVAAMTVTWAKELARHNIRVAAIAPGFCDTRRAAKFPPEILDRIYLDEC